MPARIDRVLPLALLPLLGLLVLPTACSSPTTSTESTTEPTAERTAKPAVAPTVEAVAIHDPTPVDASKMRPPPLRLQEKGRKHAPKDGRIARDTWLADGFTVEGQDVAYAFDARAGELSIFELAAWGYARGWSATASLEIRDSEDQALSKVLRPGAAVFRKFHCFTAPKEGSYRLVLKAEKEYFRYGLIRHSDYRARSADAVLALGARSTIHGYLATPDDTVTYAVDLEQGQEAAIKVLNTTVQARKQKRTRARRGAGRRARMMREAGRKRYPSVYPDLRISVSLDGEVLAKGSHFALLTPPKSGTYQVTVSNRGGGEGGLFDLQVDRAVAKRQVHGCVTDTEDEPLAGITLRFLREPDNDFVGRIVTDKAGKFAMSVPPGPYTIRMTKGRGQRMQVRTNIESDREVNAIFAPKAGRRRVP